MGSLCLINLIVTSFYYVFSYKYLHTYEFELDNVNHVTLAEFNRLTKSNMISFVLSYP